MAGRKKKTETSQAVAPVEPRIILMRHLIDHRFQKDIAQNGLKSQEELVDFYLNPSNKGYNAERLQAAVIGIRGKVNGDGVQIYHSGTFRALFTADCVA